ncbi:hypothetical protein C0J52_27579 [Blattella germanica]|nr:hypothetical protein C0J52_27579 [Blattella germanica]
MATCIKQAASFLYSTKNDFFLPRGIEKKYIYTIVDCWRWVITKTGQEINTNVIVILFYERKSYVVN